MPQRPTDWSAIGLGGDPTPGDPDKIDEVARSIGDLGRVAREIDDALAAVLNKTGNGVWVGQTADALRGKIDGHLRSFVQSIAESFEWSSTALSTYTGVMRDQQWRADNALDQGRGLAKDDPNLDSLKSTAKQAGTTQADAGRAASGTVSKAARNIKQPVSGCTIFWEMFQWLAIILIIPALIFGGPIALLAIGVNLTLFIKTAVDFAQGKAGLLDLFLAGLGMIAPTTKAIPIFQLIKAAAQLTWKGLKVGAQAVFSFFKGAFTGLTTHPFILFPGLRDFANLASKWVKSGGLWVMKGITHFPALAGMVFEKGGLAVVQGIHGLPALVKGIPPGLMKLGNATWNFTRNELGGAKWLRLILPADAGEIGQHGLLGALKIGVIDRGLLGRFVYGAPLAHGVGTALGAVPTPRLGTVDTALHLSSVDLGRVRVGNFAGPGGVNIPHISGAGAANLAGVRPPAFGTVPGFGDHLSFGQGALQGAHNLLDLHIPELSAVRGGEWTNLSHTPTGLNMDVGLGTSVLGHAPPASIPDLGAVAHAGAPGAAGLTGLHGVPGMNGVPGALGAGIPSLHLPAVASATPPTGALHVPAVAAVTPPPGLATAHLLATPPPVTAAGHLAADQVHLGALGTPNALGALPPAPHLAVAGAVPPAPVAGLDSALNLLSGGANPVAVHALSTPGGLLHGAGTQIGDHTGLALGAQHVPLDLGGVPGKGHAAGLTPPPVTAVTVPVPSLNPANLIATPPGTDAAHLLGTPPPTSAAGHFAADPAHLGVTPPPGTAAPHLAVNPANLAVTPPPVTGAARPADNMAHAGPVTPVTPVTQLPPVEGGTHVVGTGGVPVHGSTVDSALGLLSGGPKPVLAPATPPPVTGVVHLADDMAHAGAPAPLPHTAERAPAPVLPPAVSTGHPVAAPGITGTAAVPPAPHTPVPHTAVPTGTRPLPDVKGKGRATVDHLAESDVSGFDKAFAGTPSGTPAGTPSGAGRSAPPTTPVPVSGLDAAWKADSQHLHALFGSADDPLRSVRIDAWGNFSFARGQLAGAEHLLHDLRARPGESSRGTSAYEIQTVHAIGGARQQLAGLRRELADLGISPAAMDRQIADVTAQSLRDRPRLLGGAPELPAIHVSDPAGRPVEAVLSLHDAADLPTGVRVEISYDVNGVADHRVVGTPGVGTSHLTVTARPDGGVDIHAPRAGGHHGYGPNGRLLEQGVPLHGANGEPIGSVRITYGANGTGPNGHQLLDMAGDLTPLDNGGFRVTDGTTGNSLRFDATGTHLDTGTALTDAAGGRGTRFVVPEGTGGGHILTDATGSRLPQPVVTHPGGGFRIERPGLAADGRAFTYERFGADGAFTGHGHQATGPDGHIAGYVEVPHGGGLPHWLDAGHIPRPQHTVTVHGGTYQVTDTLADGAFVRYGSADGALTSTGTPLRDVHGVPGGQLAVLPPGGAAGTVEDVHAAAVAGQAVPHPGGGIRVEQPAGPGRGLTYQRYDAGGTHVADGHRLTDPGGNVAGTAEFPPAGAAAGARPQWHGQDGQPVAGHDVTVASDHLGNPADIRVTNTTTGNYQRFDHLSGSLVDDAVMLKNAGGAHLNQFGVIRHPVPGAPAAPRTLALDGAGQPLNRVQIDRPVGGGWRVTDQNGVRTGEYRVHNPNGDLTHQTFNITHDGRAGGRQFHLDNTGAKNWTLVDPAHPNATPSVFNHGTVEAAGLGSGRVRLLTGTGAEVFERKPLATGGFLDSFRRTDASGFGRFDQRTRWTETAAGGTLSDYGIRHYDTSGAAWHDVSHNGGTKHEFRDGLHKGNVLGTRNADGSWSWHRFDANHNVIASGPRDVPKAGGWTDRMPAVGGVQGDIVHRQWGTWHGPDNAGHYLEHGMDGAGTRLDTWKRESPVSGKPAGELRTVHPGRPDAFHLETMRWSEQRPPQWVRKQLMGIGEDSWRNHAFLRGDTNFQMSTWTKTPVHGGPATNGFRFTAFDGSTLDIAANGSLARSTRKLGHGNTLESGDTVALPPGAVRDPNHIPWSEGSGKLSGHRVGVQGHPDGRIWEERFTTDLHNGDWYTPNAAKQWHVSRVGYADGTVKEFQTPHVQDVTADGGPAARQHAFEGNGGSWVQTDPHGRIVGREDHWPGGTPGAGPHRIETKAPDGPGRMGWSGYNARTDSRSWGWTDHNEPAASASHTGFSLGGRGHNAPGQPFDDAFRHFVRPQGGGRLAIRDRQMLDGGGYVDSWKVTDNVAGTTTWHWQKMDKFGNPVPHPGGAQIRQWWNPRAGGGRGAWVSDWVEGAKHFRDQVVPPAGGGAPVTVREIPVGADTGRIRQYQPDANGQLNNGLWKVFDHGAVVRERTALPGGGFLEKDKWRGQWRQYDATNNVIAQRTEKGYVFEGNAFGQLRLTGREYDYRGPLTELRGWGRTIREPNRMPWGGEAIGADGARLGEALYQPYASLVMRKAALEFGQEFVLEFAANLVVNAIVDRINGTQFNGNDALKAFANASVGAAVKTGVGALLHDNKIGAFQRTGDWKAGLANVDSGKLWYRKPINHDKTWANEWAGNETPTRWRGGTYDFFFNAGVSGLTGWINGSINAAVFGYRGADGQTHYATGGAAALDGLIAGAAGVTTSVTAGVAKTLFTAGGGGRFFHRQGFADFWIQLPWKIVEKTVNSQLLPAYRASIYPPWY